MADAKIMGMPKKTAIIFGIGGVAAIAALLWYKHRQAAGAGTAAAPVTPDPAAAAYDPNAIDPNTGVPYSQEFGGYGASNGIDPTTGIPYSQEGGGVVSGSGSGGTGPPGPPGPQGPPGGPPSITTNTDWAQAGEDHLGGGSAVSAALHKYISGGALTPDQQQIANDAISWLGYPPQRAPSGFPPAMRTQPSHGHTPGKHTIVSNGNEDLHSYAVHNGITEARLLTWNPALRKYAGTGKHIPKGTKIVV